MSDNSSKILIGILAVGGVMLLVCCGGVIGLYFWFDGMTDGFQPEFARQVRVEVEDHPVIVEHIGVISSFDYDFDSSMREPGDT